MPELLERERAMREVEGAVAALRIAVGPLSPEGSAALVRARPTPRSRS
jgi:hypothetical protein